jgi:hypothetical protein
MVNYEVFWIWKPNPYDDLITGQWEVLEQGK